MDLAFSVWKVALCNFCFRLCLLFATSILFEPKCEFRVWKLKSKVSWRHWTDPFDFFNILFIFRERVRKVKERERDINVWLPLTWSSLGTWPTIQACTLSGNWTGDPLVCSPHSIHWATPARWPTDFRGRHATGTGFRRKLPSSATNTEEVAVLVVVVTSLRD